MQLDETTWARLDGLLKEALSLPAGRRSQWIDTLDPELKDLKPTLERLLAHAADVETGDFLHTLPAVAAEPLELPPSSGEPGAEIGPYRLTRVLGQGGMGEVWLAERADGMIDRPVALKLPRILAVDRALAERLNREREILASLSHPHIARLYDAGVDQSGQPYLALEYIEGEPIDQYCRRLGLGIRQRLELFLQVAQAVAYAHNKLVVHRDIKPDNILVNDQGQASLLDFGIAKLLENGRSGDSRLTQTVGRALTPDYASPEQIAGHPVTVASDVYSLGVVLYELLTDEKPYRLNRQSAAALEEAILEAEPRRPSLSTADKAAARALRDDLDNIILKALRKQPTDRYPTVVGLAEDLNRHLSGYPVQARPDSRWYRLKKFLGRHRLGVLAGLVIAVAVIGGAGVSLWQARQAVAEQQRAEQIKDFIASIFSQANPYTGSGEGAISAMDLLRQAEARLDGIPDLAPETRVELLTILTLSVSSLEDYVAAEALARKTVDEARRTLGPDHLLTLSARSALLGVLFPLGQLPEMQDEVEAVLSGIRQHPEASSQLLISALVNRIHLAIQANDLDTAAAMGEETLTLARKELGDRAPETLTVATQLSWTYTRGGNKEKAMQAAERVYRLTHEPVDADPASATARDARMVYGMALAEMGRYDEGLAHIAGVIEMMVDRTGEKDQTVGFFLNHLARYQQRAGLIRDSEVSYSRSAEIVKKALGEDNPNQLAAQANLARAQLASRSPGALEQAEYVLALTQRIQGDHEERMKWARLAAAAAAVYAGRLQQARNYLASIPEQEPDARRSGGYQDYHYVLGLVLRFQGDYEQAVELQTASLTVARNAGNNAAHQLTELGLGHLGRGDMMQAEARLRDSLAEYEKMYPRITPRRADALVGLGRVLMARGATREALPLLEQAHSFWQEFDADNRWSGLAAIWLGRCYEMEGRGAEATPLLRLGRTLLGQSPFPEDRGLLGTEP